ncbi:type III secretion system inner membrane ring lipoprotein SctJ [Pararobbsia silviterrae]|nr:type III secretion inner membrane ring lipoprotein SctJ [Pararobbsia silviterrae]
MSTRRLARAILCTACLAVAGCNDTTLLEKLDQFQANQTLAALQRRNIAARKISRGKQGYDIAVPPDDYTAAVDTLHALDLPPRARVDIAQAFPSDVMVASPSAERARLLSLIEQRLEQTLTTIESVDRASVHLSYPLDDASGSARHSIHIAALIVHEAGVDEQELVVKLKRFLRNAVADTRYEDISITLFESEPPQIAPPARAEPAPLDSRRWLSFVLGGGASVGLLSALGWARWRRMRAPRSHADEPDRAPFDAVVESSGRIDNARARDSR